MQASQWAINANVAINNTSTAAPYSEYRSILRATRTKRNSRAVFNSPISAVLFFCKRNYFYPTLNAYICVYVCMCVRLCG